MAIKKMGLILIALFVGLTCSAADLQFSDYKKLIVSADSYVKEKYPKINLNQFTREIRNEGSTISVAYRFRQPDPLVIVMGRAPVVFIDRTTMSVVSSYLTTD